MSVWQKPNTLPHPAEAGLFWGAIRVSTLGGPPEWQVHILCLDDETYDVHPNYYCGWRWADYELWMPCPVPAAPDQPQAREDAQAVWGYAYRQAEFGGITITPKPEWRLWPMTTDVDRRCIEDMRSQGSRYDLQPLFLHPAPDALRGAVEASGFLLDRLKDLEQDVNERDFYGPVHPAAARLRQALAALQAEQKGGAA